MKRFPCLVLDANIIILLFQYGLWSKVVEHCDLTLSETVIDEADFLVDSMGVEHSIDLQPDIRAGRIRVVSFTVTEIAAFRARCDPVYVQKLDDGETESLAYSLREGDPYRLCSSDAIVFKVLAVVDRSEQGVSLEEVLQEIGFARPLPRQFTKAFRDESRARGLQGTVADGVLRIRVVEIASPFRRVGPGSIRAAAEVLESKRQRTIRCRAMKQNNHAPDTSRLAR